MKRSPARHFHKYIAPKIGSFIVLLFIINLLFPGRVLAGWTIQLATGSAFNFPSQLTIKQDGEQDIDLTAEYDTRAWSSTAPYYSLRIGKWSDNQAWELESLHHKLYLRNKPAEVQRFAISHGYNLNMLNYAISKHGFIYRIGGGFVLTHPETQVRGKRYEDEGGINGFYISGAGGQASIEKRYRITDRVSFALELKITAAYAQIPINDGSANVPNYAAHGLMGIGYDFWQ